MIHRSFRTTGLIALAAVAAASSVTCRGSVDLGQAGDASYRVTVTLPYGEVMSAGQPLWARMPETFATFQKADIPPGQSRTLRVLLSEWHSFDQVGIYEVSLGIPGVEGTGYIAVEVSARNEARLRSLCEQLSRNAGGRLSPERSFATRALSFVSDHIAVPYLEALASSRSAEYLLPPSHRNK